MGNEESQQGVPGQPQQPGAPAGPYGGPRFGGAPQPPPGMRQVAPTGRPMIRPGGPGPPPRAAFPVGGAPRQPVQVGVQPWAEPPVQQPPHLRGPGPAQQGIRQAAPAPIRPSIQQQQLQQQQQQQQQQAKQQQQAMMVEEDIGVDLSNLSEEEKAKILSVMARAQDLDEDYERHKRAKDDAVEQRPQLLCPLCQSVDLATQTNKMCGDCGKNFCQKCGTFVPGEGRRSVWVCNTCSNRRKQLSAAMASGQQDTITYTTAGQKIVGDPSRKDETMSREYLHPASVDDVVSVSAGQNNYYIIIENDEDDWGEEDIASSPRRGDLGDGFSDRTSSIRRMLEEAEEEDEEEEEEDSEDEGGGGSSSSALPFYDRSPGEVYTIPEEEEDIASPISGWDGEFNPDTASSLLRWRGMGQPFQNHQQQQQQQQVQQPMLAHQPIQSTQQSVSLIGTSVSAGGGGGGFVSGSLIPSAPMGRGAGATIPRTVPLATLSQTLQQQQQWPNSQPQQQQQPQWNLQQAQMQQQTNLQSGQPQMSLQMSAQQKQQQLKSKPMDLVPGMMTQQQQLQQQQQKLQQQQKGQKGQKMGEQPQQGEWSPVTDLSPIMDVSPSLEAAEQELMEKCQEAGDSLRLGIPRATSGTISGMLADFNKALGLAATPTMEEGRSLATVPPQQQQQQLASGAVGSGGTVTTTVTTGGTEMDQNQNLVQQQFQLQQQQLMIQQQQQVIQQQQQQLQQQVHLQQQIQQQQQLQSQQQQVMIQDLQQQQVIATPLSQQQPGVVMGGTPMQQQTQSQRKVHRRLPQPTMDQMQAAVAIAAQTPRSKSQQPPRTPSIGVAAPSPFQRPVSPMMAPGGGTRQQMVTSSTGQLTSSTSLFDSSSSFLSVQQQPTIGLSSQTLTSTSSISPTPRKDSDLLADTDTSGGRKIRRRLPPVPLDQEPTSVPLRRTKDRARTLSMGAMPLSASDRTWDRKMPLRTTSLDDGMSLTTAVTTSSSILDYIGLTSNTDTYLQLLTSKDFGGLLGPTPTTTTTTTSSVLAGITSTLGLSSSSLLGPSMLGRRDLSAPHSLSSYLRSSGMGVVPSTSASYLLDHPSATSDLGSKLPTYMSTLKQQLREELRSVTDQRRRITDPDLSGLLSHSTWADSTYDPLRKLGSSTLPLTSGGGRMGGPQARRGRHRRHASDTKLSTFTSLGRDEFLDDPLFRYKLYQPSSNMPFKSFEFESIDDHLRADGLYGSSPYRSSLQMGRGSTYPRRSSLTDMRLRADDMDRLQLRETSVNSLGGAGKSQDPALRRYSRELARLRRHTDTGLSSLGLGLDPYGRTPPSFGYSQGRSLRKPRSWHPSPYVSEDEDEREEKKAKIKAEIARRRQHIEENARLHDELYKVARLRDATGYVSPAYGERLYTSPISLESGGSSQESSRDPQDSSVLQAMDDLMRSRDLYRNHHPSYTSAYGSPQHTRASRYDRSHPSWQYEYGYPEEEDPLYDPVYDYSPLATDSETDLAPMPLLPDMPTRSRKLLQDLGSSPLGPHSRQYHHSRSGGAPQPYDDYEGRGAVEDMRRQPPSSQSSGDRQQSSHLRKAQNSKTSQKYDFPVKRILLTRDPKDRSVSGNGLGMKVVGGKEIPGSNGMIGAYVARIYPGGVVETLGEVREGDQVLEWNGVPLTGKTYEDVQRIIASSSDEVEIVIRSDFNMLSSRSSSHQHHHRDHHQQQNQHQSRLSRNNAHHDHQQQHSRSNNSTSYHQSGSYRTSRGDVDGYNRNYDTSDFLRSPTDEGVHNSNYMDSYHSSERCGSVTPPRGYRSSSPRQQKIGSPVGKGDCSDNKEKYRAEDISGEIQLQVCYDSKASILYVTIVRARNLVTSRDNSGLPDPYVKCYLLPERCVENQRRTRYFSRCSNPEWKQTMVYPDVPQDQLKKKHLEISVWNYDVNRPPEFLGEVILDLKDTSVIDEQSRWYKLHPHDPKKYPSHTATLNNEEAIKMARLNNPAQKTLYFENGDDIRKSNNLEKKFFRQLTKKSNVNESYTRASEQSELETTSTLHGQHHRSSITSAGLPWRRLLHSITLKQNAKASVLQSGFMQKITSPVLAIRV
ncbi:uncharacterized protein LOC129226627 [Uloborus diversus]|uniref:uncharacterized protein LOC129226627 n=1 Tax=Uloborus diversus TaxID=327109 RepID=UPI0024090335|nr:uncharacterized protein LOC129226627 [Uloborus diversus]